LEIDPKDIVILERIGADRGVQGRVYKGNKNKIIKIKL